jgi:hypothetical protein
LTQVLFTGRRTITTLDLYLSIMSESNSHAHYFLLKYGVNKQEFAKFWEQNYNHNDAKINHQQATEILEEYCVNLTQLAREDRLEPVIGRETDIQEMITALARRFKANVLLVGDPGVGKTTFLRHLTARLAKTHRAFLVPTSHFNMLASPEMPVFWAGQNYRSSLTNLVILEDAEALLGKRRGSNDDQVSNLLNFSDGMMGDCMKVQIVTTVNAPLEKLDPAITRRGRMLGYRQFRRLTRAEALRLSTAKNLTLGDGDEFSLADIYRGADSADPLPAEPTMGFHRQTTR